MTAIKLSEAEWADIYYRISKDYPPAVLLIREVMKRELGFTPRRHREWKDQTGYITSFYLDFYDKQKETFFRLKYL